MKTLAIVPCRSGSKGIKNKNTRIFQGRPLFAWAVGIGRATCDETYVSTDDVDVARLATMYGAKTILRPTELATDEAPMLPVIQHALTCVSGPPDVVVLLQPTSPWRTEKHVRDALELLETSGADSVVSLVEIPAIMSPGYAVKVWKGRAHGFDTDLSRRQDVEPAYYRDGTVYATRRTAIEAGSLYGKECRALIIPAHESVTLDTEDDWTHAVHATVGKG